MLISYLAERTIILPFDDIDSLMAKSNFKMSITPNTAQEGTFKNSKIPLYQKAWAERIEPYLDLYAKYPYSKQSQLLLDYPDIAAYNSDLSGL